MYGWSLLFVADSLLTVRTKCALLGLYSVPLCEETRRMDAERLSAITWDAWDRRAWDAAYRDARRIGEARMYREGLLVRLACLHAVLSTTR